MMLTFTRYVNTAPLDVERNLDRVISSALEATTDRAIERRDTTVDNTSTEIDRGRRVTGGFVALDGTEVRVAGCENFSTLEISVPWSQPDAGSTKLWTAVKFASMVADGVGIAA